MYGIKVLLSSAALSCILAAVILLWLEDKANCDIFICKIIETILIIVGAGITKEVSKIKLK